MDNSFEALGKPVLWKDVSQSTEKEGGINYHLYYPSRGQRSKGMQALNQLFADYNAPKSRLEPHMINNSAYYTVYIDPQLGERLSQDFPETHQIEAVRKRGGVRLFHTPPGDPTIEKLETALRSTPQLGAA